MKKFIIFTDGASRGNPGHSAVGFIIKTTDGVTWVQVSRYLGITTNNVAEYQAVKLALEKLTYDFSHFLPAEVEVRLDSQLICRQLSGLYKVKKPTLKVIFNRIRQLEGVTGIVTYTHIPRNQNFLADRLANIALDNRTKVKK